MRRCLIKGKDKFVVDLYVQMGLFMQYLLHFMLQPLSDYMSEFSLKKKKSFNLTCTSNPCKRVSRLFDYIAMPLFIGSQLGSGEIEVDLLKKILLRCWIENFKT